MLDVRRLWLLRELALRGTIAAVAQANAYTPSAVSQQLKVLESEAGAVLLERVGRGVRLTAAAHRLVDRTESVLETLERAEAELRGADVTVAGTVRLAAFQTAAHALLPRALETLAERYPHLRVEVSEEEPETALPGLVAREFDLVLVEEYPNLPPHRLPQVEYHRLLRDPLRLAQRRRTVRPLTELSSAAWVLEPAGTAARTWATTVCRRAGFEPDVRYETADLLLHSRLIAAGRAVGFLPALLPADPAIRLDPLPGAPARRVFGVIRRGAGAHPGLTAVRRALRAAVDSA